MGERAGRARRTTSLYDLRVVVDRIEAGLCAGSRSATTSRSRTRAASASPRDGISACLRLRPRFRCWPPKQRRQPPGDWLEEDSLVACPDPDERVVMRIERIRRRRIPTEELT